MARARTYTLLAVLLARPPAPELLTHLAHTGQAIDAGDDTPIAQAWRALAASAERASVSALDDEFHALFIGVGRGELVPYGSWYMTGFMMDKPLARLRQDLVGLGIERRDEVFEPEDNACALCETMALLTDPDDPAAFDIQRDFFESHVGAWLGILFRDMQSATSADFYRPVGMLGAAFMDFEHAYLGMPE